MNIEDELYEMEQYGQTEAEAIDEETELMDVMSDMDEYLGTDANVDDMVQRIHRSSPTTKSIMTDTIQRGSRRTKQNTRKLKKCTRMDSILNTHQTRSAR